MTTRGGPSTLSSAADALHAEEVKRTREFLRIGWVVAVGVVIAVMITPGDRRIATALIATVGVGVVGSIGMHQYLRDPAHYDPARMTALAIACVVAGQLGILYVGAFSGAPIAVALGLYFFCRTESITNAIAIYALAAGAHAFEGGLVISGMIADPGFYPVGSHASLQAQIAGQIIMQFAYGLCFWLARITRTSSLRSIEQLQKATRLAAQRDVQLVELRRDLDRALEVGGPGRFTGHAVGAWQLGNLLGRGAMGEVYEATHGSTGAEAAVKLLRRERLADPHHVERFFREVRVASAIESPHVVRVLEASTPRDSIPFLAMERLRGHTLSELLRPRVMDQSGPARPGHSAGTLDDAELAAMVTQIGGVLELARAAGIVHRDIKPQNLFRTDDGTWKVLDFGIAVLADSSGTLTRGAAIGTPAYMAPEQAKGEAVDHRADVYGLAAVIYRCITGRAPFVGQDTPSLLFAVVHQTPLRPSAVAPLGKTAALAFDLALIVGLAKVRDERLESASALIAAFTAAMAGALPDDLCRRARAIGRHQPWAEPAAADDADVMSR